MGVGREEPSRNSNPEASFLNSTIAALSWSHSLPAVALWQLYRCGSGQPMGSSSLYQKTLGSCHIPRLHMSCQTWQEPHMQWHEFNSGKHAGNAGRQLSSKFLIKSLTQSSLEALEDARWCQERNLCFVREGSGRPGRETIPRSMETKGLKPTLPNSHFSRNTKPGPPSLLTPPALTLCRPQDELLSFAALLTPPRQHASYQNSSRARREHGGSSTGSEPPAAERKPLDHSLANPDYGTACKCRTTVRSNTLSPGFPIHMGVCLHHETATAPLVKACIRQFVPVLCAWCYLSANHRYLLHQQAHPAQTAGHKAPSLQLLSHKKLTQRSGPGHIQTA